jgi:hypothetical protein
MNFLFIIKTKILFSSEIAHVVQNLVLICLFSVHPWISHLITNIGVCLKMSNWIRLAHLKDHRKFSYQALHWHSIDTGLCFVLHKGYSLEDGWDDHPDIETPGAWDERTRVQNYHANYLLQSFGMWPCHIDLPVISST